MGLVDGAREVYDVARNRHLVFMAAAVAHYTLVSLVPLAMLALSLASIVGGDEYIEALVSSRLGPVLSDAGETALLAALTEMEGRLGAGLVGVAVAVWGGSRIFRGLDVAFAELYEEYAAPSVPKRILDAGVVLGLLALAVGAMVAVALLVRAEALAVGSPRLAGAVLLLVTLVLVLLPIYYVLPPCEVTVRAILPGSVLGAGGLLALQLGFAFYVRHAARYNGLGVLGAILLFVTWLYVGGIVLLLGGAVNYVYGDDARDPDDASDRDDASERNDASDRIGIRDRDGARDGDGARDRDDASDRGHSRDPADTR